MAAAARLPTLRDAADGADICSCLLRRDRAPGLLAAAELLELRLEAALELAVDAVEIKIDHWGDVEGEQLGEQQPAHHRDAERLAQLGTRAGAERDRQGAEDRREGGHHDRPEAQQ